MKRSTPDASTLKTLLGTPAPLLTGLLASWAIGLPLWAQDAPAPLPPAPEPHATPQDAPVEGVRIEVEHSTWLTSEGRLPGGEDGEVEYETIEELEAHVSVSDEEGRFVVMVLRKSPGGGAFVFESIDVDLSPTALKSGLARPDLDEREAFLDDLISRLAVRDDASSAAKRWLRAQASGKGELAWTARTALRELDRRDALFGGGVANELDPLIHVLGSAPNTPVMHVGNEPSTSVELQGEPTLRAFLTQAKTQSSSEDPTWSWRFAPLSRLQDTEASSRVTLFGEDLEGDLPGAGLPATQGLWTTGPGAFPARSSALPASGLFFEQARPDDRSPGRELRAGAHVELKRVNVFPVADLDAFEDFTLELRCGPDSVQLRVLEVPEAKPMGAPGDQQYTAQVREYHASSLPGLLEQHPELHGLLPFRSPSIAPAESLPRPDVLGVYVQAVAPDEAVEIMTAAGELVHAGMRVVRVEPGTIAESMGVANGSLILEVCDYPIIDGQAISRALEQARTAAESGAGVGAIEVEWRDPWGRRQSRVWRGQLAR